MSLAVGLKTHSQDHAPVDRLKIIQLCQLIILWGVNKTNAVVVQMLRIYLKRSLDIPWSSFE